MWYSHLHSFLLHHNFQHDQSFPCIFILKESSGFAIVAIYVDDINLVGTPTTCKKVVSLLTNRFEMKLLGKLPIPLDYILLIFLMETYFFTKPVTLRRC